MIISFSFLISEAFESSGTCITKRTNRQTDRQTKWGNWKKKNENKTCVFTHSFNLPCICAFLRYVTRDERGREKTHTHTHKQTYTPPSHTHRYTHIPHTHTHPPIHPKNQQRNSNVKCLLFKLHKRFVQTLT